MERIDLNCDLGEGCGSDAELMPLITSANVACGGHAGDEGTMRRTVRLAIEQEVAIGAHPGYEDRENFGRLPQSLTFTELRSVLLRQLDAFGAIVVKAGGRLSHVKPHGALYNQSADDAEIAGQIASVVAEWDSGVVLVGLSGSHSIAEARRAGLQVAREAFGDRGYTARGRLVPRSAAAALITDTSAAASQVLDIVRYGRVRSDEGTMVKVEAETICLHGDGATAVEMAAAIRASLEQGGISIRSLNG
jgi:UPF0271 protein